jgi:hypothetical protein
MNKVAITTAAALSALAAFYAWGTAPFGKEPDWESADKRDTWEIAVADFNGDGWQTVVAERKTGNGDRHVFYINHFPARTITAVRVNGAPVPRADYCFDARAGWLSLKDAPPNGARVEVDYKWSNRLDLFAGNMAKAQTDGRDAVYFNTGKGLNVNPGWLSDNEDAVCCVAAGDYDGDGDVDVAIGGIVSGLKFFVKVYRNTGAGLEKSPSWTYAVDKSQICELAWGDVDNDDYLELAVADMWLDKFYVFKNSGGNLESSPSWTADYGEPSGVAWGDMDGDGDMDLAGTTYSVEQPDGYAYVFRNTNGALERTHCWRNAAPTARCTGPAWGDFNGDGWLDLFKGVNSGQDPYSDIYYSRRGVLATVPDWESEEKVYSHLTFLIDCNGDRYLDVFQSIGEGAMAYYRRDGNLEKTPSWRYAASPYYCFGIAVGDMNADGSPDVAAGQVGDSNSATGGPNVLFFNKTGIGVRVKNFAAAPCARGVALRWEVNEAVAGFNLLREVNAASAAAEPARINDALITGRSPYRYLDEDVTAGKTYRYWLEVVPLAGPAELHGPLECAVDRKAAFALAQNRPNPARAITTVAFSVPAPCEATLGVYDLAGRRVASRVIAAKAGPNELDLDVSALAPGVYAYRLEAGGEAAAKRMVVVR